MPRSQPTACTGTMWGWCSPAAAWASTWKRRRCFGSKAAANGSTFRRRAGRARVAPPRRRRPCRRGPPRARSGSRRVVGRPARRRRARRPGQARPGRVAGSPRRAALPGRPGPGPGRRRCRRAAPGMPHGRARGRAGARPGSLAAPARRAGLRTAPPGEQLLLGGAAEGAPVAVGLQEGVLHDVGGVGLAAQPPADLQACQQQQVRPVVLQHLAPGVVVAGVGPVEQGGQVGRHRESHAREPLSMRGRLPQGRGTAAELQGPTRKKSGTCLI